MENPNLIPDGFFFPLFEELSFTVSKMALHPRFTLRMFSEIPIFDIYEDRKKSLIRYGLELFDKLTEIKTFEYHYLMTYHLENIVKKREWVLNFMLLITCNKELFISKCGIENYTFLYEMVIDHSSAFNNAFMSHLSDSCEECRNRIITNIKHDAEFIKHLDGPERDYFCSNLNLDHRRFAKFWNFKLDSSELYDFKDENDKIESKKQFKERVKEAVEKKDFNGFEGLKKISVNCSAVEFGEIFGDFIKTTKNKNGVYLFEYDNTKLSKWTSAGIFFNVGSQVCAKTLDDYWPSVRKTVFRDSKPDRKR